MKISSIAANRAWERALFYSSENLVALLFRVKKRRCNSIHLGRNLTVLPGSKSVIMMPLNIRIFIKKRVLSKISPPRQGQSMKSFA